MAGVTKQRQRWTVFVYKSKQRDRERWRGRGADWMCVGGAESCMKNQEKWKNEKRKRTTMGNFKGVGAV
jgi:hypothetical protein